MDGARIEHTNGATTARPHAQRGGQYKYKTRPQLETTPSPIVVLATPFNDFDLIAPVWIRRPIAALHIWSACIPPYEREYSGRERPRSGRPRPSSSYLHLLTSVVYRARLWLLLTFSLCSGMREGEKVWYEKRTSRWIGEPV